SMAIRHARQMRLDASFTGLLTTDERMRIIRPPGLVPISAEALPYALVLGNPLPHGGFFGCRSAVVDAGGYRDVPVEDYDLWLRMATKGSRMARIARPGYLYRSHATQSTASTSWQIR